MTALIRAGQSIGSPDYSPPYPPFSAAKGTTTGFSLRLKKDMTKAEEALVAKALVAIDEACALKTDFFANTECEAVKASILWAKGEAADAVALYQKTLDEFKKTLGSLHRKVMTYETTLGGYYLEQGFEELALGSAEKALKLFEMTEELVKPHAKHHIEEVADFNRARKHVYKSARALSFAYHGMLKALEKIGNPTRDAELKACSKSLLEAALTMRRRFLCKLVALEEQRGENKLAENGVSWPSWRLSRAVSGRIYKKYPHLWLLGGSSEAKGGAGGPQTLQNYEENAADYGTEPSLAVAAAEEFVEHFFEAAEEAARRAVKDEEWINGGGSRRN